VSLEGLRERYDAVNIKIDKDGRTDRALAMCRMAALALGLRNNVAAWLRTAGDGAGVAMLRNRPACRIRGPLLLAVTAMGASLRDSLIYPRRAELWDDVEAPRRHTSGSHLKRHCGHDVIRRPASTGRRPRQQDRRGQRRTMPAQDAKLTLHSRPDVEQAHGAQ